MRERAKADVREALHGPDLIRMRRLDSAFVDATNAEVERRYPVMTVENAQEVIRFQSAHIEQLRRESVEYQSALRRVRGA